MHKIDGQYNVGGEFVDGNSGAGINATRLNAKWFNTIQRELCNVVQDAGITLSDEDDAQVVKSIVNIVIKTIASKTFDGHMRFVSRSGQELDVSANEISFVQPTGERCVVDCNGFTLIDASGSMVARFNENLSIQSLKILDDSGFGEICIENGLIVVGKSGEGRKIVSISNNEVESFVMRAVHGKIQNIEAESIRIEKSKVIVIDDSGFGIENPGERTSRYGLDASISGFLEVAFGCDIGMNCNVKGTLNAKKFVLGHLREAQGSSTFDPESIKKELPLNPVKGEVCFVKVSTQTANALYMCVYDGKKWYLYASQTGITV